MSPQAFEDTRPLKSGRTGPGSGLYPRFSGATAATTLHRSIPALLALIASACLGACFTADSEDDGDSNTSGSFGDGLPQGCDAAALAAQCPPGSDPLTGPDAYEACQGESGAQITDSTGAISAICQGQNACLVMCNLQNPCTCGIDRITDEGIFCVECSLAAACGNAVCDGGETPQSCPVDCAAVCTPEQGRCSGGQLQICQNNGSWSDVACRSDQTCAISAQINGSAFCQTRISPSGGTRPPIAPAPQLASDPARINVLDSIVGCNGGEADINCFAIDMVRGGQQVLLHDGNFILADVDGPNRQNLNLEGFPYNPSGGSNPRLDIQGSRLAWCRDRKVRVHDLDTGGTQNMSEFVDDTIPLECAAVAMADHGRLVAAAMKLEGSAMVAVWDAATGEPQRLLRFVDQELGASAPAAEIALDPAGQWLVECRNPDDRFSGVPVFIVWNLAEGRYWNLIQFEGGCDGGNMMVRPGHFQIYQGGRLWDLERAETVWSLRLEGSGNAAFSADGRVIALNWGRDRDGNGCTGLLNADSGLLIRCLGTGPGARAFSDDGRYLLIGSYLYDDRF